MIKNKLKIPVIVVCSLLLLVVIGSIVFFSFCYHAVDVEEFLASNNTVTVNENDGIYYFDGPGEDTALIFYPGSNVEATAYAPLMHSLSENGIDCFLVTMPFNFAIFGQNKAAAILDNYSYEHFYIGGHSLGGYVASAFAHDNEESLDGIIFLAAYATDDFSNSDLKILSIYGSLDTVLNMNNVISGRNLMPETYSEAVITGGNHSQMGSYGHQLKDTEATITPEEQVSSVTEIILNFV